MPRAWIGKTNPPASSRARRVPMGYFKDERLAKELDLDSAQDLNLELKT